MQSLRPRHRKNEKPVKTIQKSAPDPSSIQELKALMTGSLQVLQKKKALIAAMGKNRCFISRAVRVVGCTRDHFYNFYRDDAVFKQAIDDLTEAKCDEMEACLEDKAKKHDVVANIFWLKCKGRKRGWSERLGVDINTEATSIPNEIVDEAVKAALRSEAKRLKESDNASE